jgi:hypothetical protein
MQKACQKTRTGYTRRVQLAMNHDFKPRSGNVCLQARRSHGGYERRVAACSVVEDIAMS